MSILSTQSHGELGASVTFGAINESTGDQIRVDGRTQLRCKVSGATPRTVTITRINCNQGFAHPLVFTVPADGKEYNSPILDPAHFPSLANITYSAGAQADLTVAAVRTTDNSAIA